MALVSTGAGATWLPVEDFNDPRTHVPVDQHGTTSDPDVAALARTTSRTRALVLAARGFAPYQPSATTSAAG